MRFCRSERSRENDADPDDDRTDQAGGGSIRIDGTDVGRERVKALSRVGAIVESPIFFLICQAGTTC